MAKLTLSGVDYEIRPFKLADLQAAAPAIDRVWAAAGSQGAQFSLEAMLATSDDMLGALVIGTDGVTVENLKQVAKFEDLAAIRRAFDAMLVEAGFLSQGEVPPADADEAPPAGPSPTE
jgi:hypothetical protein